MGLTWYRRMGDIPGLDYEPLVALDRATLHRHDAVPQLHKYEFDGKVHESLWWEDEDGEGGSSASPAHDIGDIESELSTGTLLTRLSECLELPGEASDYHFAIQGVANSFWAWKRRAREPDIVEWAERLSWLDIHLIQACPDAVRDEYSDTAEGGRREFYRVSAFSSLLEFYEREGFLGEAFEVARIADQFGQGEPVLARVEVRSAALRAEDGD